MVEQVDHALMKLAGRERHTQPADLVFPGSEGGYMDSSALPRGYLAALKRADVRVLRFQTCVHLRVAGINYAAIVQIRAWMGHADVTTTALRAAHTTRGCAPHAFRADGDAADGGPCSAA